VKYNEASKEAVAIDEGDSGAINKLEVEMIFPMNEKLQRKNLFKEGVEWARMRFLDMQPFFVLSKIERVKALADSVGPMDDGTWLDMIFENLKEEANGIAEGVGDSDSDSAEGDKA
jgi:hypothetical protein